MNTLLATELTAFLDYDKYDRIGFNSGNSRNGLYARKLHTEYGDLEIMIPRDRNGNLNNRLWHRISVRMTHEMIRSPHVSKRGDNV